jgi:ABC-type Fe3+-hydroxamate transport system substrate-binding protein
MQKRTFTDQMGRLISLNFPPKRIISLVPSKTELLFDLGLDEELIGITKFCIHPHDKFKSKTKIGGTKKLDLDKIRALNPDLIIGNKEENDQAQIEELMLEFPVWMSDITLFEDAIEMIGQIAELTGKKENGLQITSSIEKSFAEIPQNQACRKSVAYFIWKDPYMLAGKDTFIDAVLEKAGFDNVVAMSRYPAMSLSEIRGLKPEHIFLSSEPYPFKNEHVVEMETIFPDSTVWIVDGELFSWYGSRLRFTSDYLLQLLQKINCHS